MKNSSCSLLVYCVNEGVFVDIQHCDVDLLLPVLPDFFQRHVSGSRDSYTSVIPYDEIPSGDRDPSYYVYDCICLGMSELVQRRAAIY